MPTPLDYAPKLSPRIPWRRAAGTAVASIALIVVLVTGVYYVRVQDVDIHSGQFRNRIYVLGLCISSRIDDSPVSRELGPATRPANWHRTYAFYGLADHSVTYLYQRALRHAHALDRLWAKHAFTSAPPSDPRSDSTPRSLRPSSARP